MQPRRMPEVELQPDAGVGKVVQNACRLIVVVQEVARHVIGVQGFDRQRQARCLGQRPGEVFGVALFRLRTARHALSAVPRDALSATDRGTAAALDRALRMDPAAYGVAAIMFGVWVFLVARLLL